MHDIVSSPTRRNDDTAGPGGASFRLVERDRQLAELLALRDDADRGDGRIAVVSGASASGKTWLLHHVLGEVRAGGALVFEASGIRAERGLPLGVLRRLIEPVEGLVDLREHLDRLADSGDDDPDRLRAMAGVAALLVGLAVGRTLVIAVDDVHHADPCSLDLLLALVHRIRWARVLVVLTEPARLPHGHTGFHAELLRQPGCSWIRLRMLSEAGTRTFLSAFFPVAAAARLAEGCHETTGGNPLLLRALVEDRPAERTEHVDMFRLRPAAAFTQAVLDCLHRLGPDVLPVARGVAVLGDAGPTTLLGRLLESRAMDLRRDLDDLEECGILREGTFREPLARAAILHATPTPALTELHARAALLLHDDGAPAPEVARHVLESDVDRAEWAVDVLRDAAEYAAARDDLAFAERCLASAHRHAPDASTRAAIRARIVGLAWRSNPAAAQAHLPGLVDDLGAGLLPVADILPVVSSLSWSGRARAAADALGRLLLRPGLEPPAALAVEVARRWLIVRDPVLRATLPRPSHELTRVATDPVTAAFADAETALSAVLGARPPREATELAVTLLQRCQLADGTLEPVVFGLLTLIYAGALDTAQVWTDRLVRECQEREVPTWHAVLTSVRAEIALRRVDLRSAARHAEEALALLPADSWGTLVALPLAALVQAGSAMGRRAQAHELLRRPPPVGLHGTVLGVHLLRARGRAASSVGQHHAALRDFTACGEQLGAWGDVGGRWLRWRIDAAEACLALGQTRLAQTLVDEELRLEPQTADGDGDGAVDGALMLVMARCVEPARGLPMLERAVAALERGDDRLRLAVALGELGRAHRAVGESTLSRVAIRRAWHLARSCGAETLCHQLIPTAPRSVQVVAVRSSAQDDRVRPRAAEALTRAEARVATLAADGHMNREIAAQLFVTVSTVEQHLTRIYRKLRITRRSELPARLSEIDGVPDGRSAHPVRRCADRHRRASGSTGAPGIP